MESLASSTIYMLCPCVEQPDAWVRQLYRYVDILNGNGFQAYILHPERGFKLTWLDHRTPVAYVPDIQLLDDDFLVCQADADLALTQMACGHKKVIINQDCFNTFQAFPVSQTDPEIPYLDRDFIASLVVSAQGKSYLEHAFPKHKVYQIRHAVGAAAIDFAAKKKIICYSSETGAQDSEQVFNILRCREALGDFEFKSIAGMEPEAARVLLREAVFFMSFARQEEFNLTIAEAMVSGCVVIGYHGYGSKELFSPEFSCAIESGDVVEFARMTGEMIERYAKAPAGILALGQAAAQFIAGSYTEKQEEIDLTTAWAELQRYRGKSYYFHESDAVIRDFAEFSNEDIGVIEARMNDFHEYTGAEWNKLPEPDFVGKTRYFYASSQFYIYDLLTANFNKQAVVDKLQSFNPLILETILDHPGKKFIEFGGGLGVFCEIVHSLGKEVTYLDIPGLVSKFATWRINKYAIPVQVILSDPELFSLQDSYDIIYTDAVLEHTINPEQIVRTLCEHLNAGGVFILLVDLEGPSETFPMHRHVDIAPLHRIMRENALSPIQGEGEFCSIWRKAG
jgi:hypothetical protein